MSRPWVWMMLSSRSIEQSVNTSYTIASRGVSYPIVAPAPFHTLLVGRASCALYIHTVARCVSTTRNWVGPDRT